MKKLIFATTVCILLTVVLLFPFFLSDDLMYTHKGTKNVYVPWVEVWLQLSVWFCISIVMTVFFYFGEWLYEYIRKED